MFSPGGVAYVYLCYGIHSLFNIITNVDSIPHAILIRAIEPTEGLSFMQKRRNMENMQRRLTAGPGALTEALGISTRHSALDLTGDRIWLNHGRAVSGAEILASPRVGIGYAGPDANRPWRFRLRGSDWTSPAK